MIENTAKEKKIWDHALHSQFPCFFGLLASPFLSLFCISWCWCFLRFQVTYFVECPSTGVCLMLQPGFQWHWALLITPSLWKMFFPGFPWYHFPIFLFPLLKIHLNLLYKLFSLFVVGLSQDSVLNLLLPIYAHDSQTSKPPERLLLRFKSTYPSVTFISNFSHLSVNLLLPQCLLSQWVGPFGCQSQNVFFLLCQHVLYTTITLLILFLRDLLTIS